MRALALLVAHNEAVNLPAVVAELRRVAPALDILVVDDASDDATPALVGTLGVRHMRLGQRLGVGGAVRAGLRWARGRGYGRVVRLDADGQHAPRDIGELLAALDGADAVVGSRYAGKSGYRTPAGRRLAQRILASGLSLMARRKVTDPTSGF